MAEEAIHTGEKEAQWWFYLSIIVWMEVAARCGPVPSPSPQAIGPHVVQGKGNGLILYKGRFRLITGKKFLTERGVKHWNKLPKEVVGSAALNIFKSHVDMIWWWIWQGWWLNSMILRNFYKSISYCMLFAK